MTGDDLPDDAHVVHYVRPTSVHEDGSIDGSGFRLRADEIGLSVNWLECFSDHTKVQQLAEVRRRSRLTMRRRGRLAELDVGITKQHVRHKVPSLRFVHKPLAADQRYEADPSHSEIEGLPPGDSPQAALIGDMVAECIQDVHPAMDG